MFSPAAGWLCDTTDPHCCCLAVALLQSVPRVAQTGKLAPITGSNQAWVVAGDWTFAFMEVPPVSRDWEDFRNRILGSRRPMIGTVFAEAGANVADMEQLRVVAGPLS